MSFWRITGFATRLCSGGILRWPVVVWLVPLLMVFGIFVFWKDPSMP